jgi:hypothetical protein
LARSLARVAGTKQGRADERGIAAGAAATLNALHGFAVPDELAHFVPAIERSRAMLNLEDDWDGEGSPGYAEETWRRAVRLAIESAKSFLLTHDEPAPIPAFSKGPDGSVDVLWRSGRRKVMINVPAEEDEPITYHGFDRENPHREIKGCLDPANHNEWILVWLTE